MALVITADKKSRYKDNTNLLDLIYCERIRMSNISMSYE